MKTQRKKLTPEQKKRAKEFKEWEERHEKEITEKMKEIKDLIAEFGLILFGHDPGISAYIENSPSARGNGFWGEPISLGRNEWKWLEPLLKELRDYRKTKS